MKGDKKERVRKGRKGKRKRKRRGREEKRKKNQVLWWREQREGLGIHN